MSILTILGEINNIVMGLYNWMFPAWVPCLCIILKSMDASFGFMHVVNRATQTNYLIEAERRIYASVN